MNRCSHQHHTPATQQHSHRPAHQQPLAARSRQPWQHMPMHMRGTRSALPASPGLPRRRPAAWAAAGLPPAASCPAHRAAARLNNREQAECRAGRVGDAANGGGGVACGAACSTMQAAQRSAFHAARRGLAARQRWCGGAARAALGQCTCHGGLSCAQFSQDARHLSRLTAGAHGKQFNHTWLNSSRAHATSVPLCCTKLAAA